MKKIIFAVISLTLFVSCRIFHTTEPTNSAHWYVKNMTWKPIVIKKRDFRTERLLNPGDSISVFHRLPHYCPVKAGKSVFEIVET